MLEVTISRDFRYWSSGILCADDHGLHFDLNAGFCRLFDNRAPGLAFATTTHPFDGGPTTFGAGVSGGSFGHAASLAAATDSGLVTGVSCA
jgi:hypothetical protein